MRVASILPCPFYAIMAGGAGYAEEILRSAGVQVFACRLNRDASRFALLRMRVDEAACVSCGKCRRPCPMGLDISVTGRRGENAAGCIHCLRCVEECPQKALKF